MRLSGILNQCRPIPGFVYGHENKQTILASGRGNDPRRFVRAVIKPRPATISLAHRAGLSSSDSGAIWSFWFIACGGSIARGAASWSKRSPGAWANIPRPRFPCAFWGMGRANSPGRKPPRSYRTSWDKVRDAEAYLVARGWEHRVPGPIRAIGVDEIQYAKGHKYWAFRDLSGSPA